MQSREEEEEVGVLVPHESITTVDVLVLYNQSKQTGLGVLVGRLC